MSGDLGGHKHFEINFGCVLKWTSCTCEGDSNKVVQRNTDITEKLVDKTNARWQGDQRIQLWKRENKEKLEYERIWKVMKQKERLEAGGRKKGIKGDIRWKERCKFKKETENYNKEKISG
jgi:hypothetical protein